MLRIFPLLAALLFLSSCEFKSYRAAYRFEPGVTYTLRYSSGLQAKAEGSRGKSPYGSTAYAVFSYNELADRALCTPRNAARIVRRLIDSGYVRVVGAHKNDGNNYEPVLDRGLEVANAA